MPDIVVDHKGRITLPPYALKALGAKTGKPVRLRVEGERVVLERIAKVDPFAAAFEKPEPDAFEKLMDAQVQDREDAEERFEELLENPPEIRPEDNDDMWR